MKSRLSKKGVACGTLLLLCVLGGCSQVCVTDETRTLISQHAQNATTFRLVVDQDENVPAYVKDWLAAEERTWFAFEAWSRNENVEND